MPIDYADRTSAVSMRWLRAAMTEKFGEDVSPRLAGCDFDSDAIVSPKLLDIVARKWDELVPIPTGETTFSPGSGYTFKLPARVKKLTISAVGGGGGGGSGSMGGGGSSGMGVSSIALDADMASLVTINVGAGGGVGKDGGDTTIEYLQGGKTQTLTYKGGLAGSSSGTAGASSGDGSKAGGQGSSQQVQTGGGYYNNSIGGAITSYSSLSSAQNAYRSNTTSRPASQTNWKPADYLIEGGTASASGYDAGSWRAQNTYGSISAAAFSGYGATSSNTLVYGSVTGSVPTSWLASQNVSGKRYLVYASSYTPAQGYYDGGHDGEGDNASGFGGYWVETSPAYYTLQLYNISGRTTTAYYVYRITSSWVAPTYRTDYTKGTGGASVVSGYGKGGNGSSSGQNGYVKLRW